MRLAAASFAHTPRFPGPAAGLAPHSRRGPFSRVRATRPRLLAAYAAMASPPLAAEPSAVEPAEGEPGVKRARLGGSATGSGASTDEAAEAEAPSAQAAHAAKAWAWFRALGSPRLHVAPMVDQSELAFRMLCRRYGATAAYTPMLHSRLFAESAKYRAESFTSCAADRPLFVQFCSNEPDHLVAAAKLVAGDCDAVDLNLGCPQRIAKRGFYGAYLMDDLPLVRRLVESLAREVAVPVTVKIRIFPELARTVAYARMLEAAGASLIAVHGRTRDVKDPKACRADWAAIRAVKEAVGVPVLANGNIRNLDDVAACLAATGADGVMSAESLLDDPSLFAGTPPVLPPGVARPLGSPPPAGPARGCDLLEEYLDLCEVYPTPGRMVVGHAHKMLGDWLQEHADLRAVLHSGREVSLPKFRAMAAEMRRRILACGRSAPVRPVSDRAREKAAKEAARAEAAAEQEREAAALAEIGVAAESQRR